MEQLLSILILTLLGFQTLSIALWILLSGRYFRRSVDVALRRTEDRVRKRYERSQESENGQAPDVIGPQMDAVLKAGQPFRRPYA